MTTHHDVDRWYQEVSTHLVHLPPITIHTNTPLWAQLASLNNRNEEAICLLLEEHVLSLLSY